VTAYGNDNSNKDEEGSIGEVSQHLPWKINENIKRLEKIERS